MIGIRADANETVATGHIMRCITIAKQLKKLGENVLFFVADAYPIPMLEQAGMDYRCLNSKWDGMEEELPSLLSLLKEVHCNKLLVDSYQASETYLEQLHQVVKTIYIDDLFEHVYKVDMIINYNGFYEKFPYHQVYSNQTKLLLGAAYVPLREEFTLERSEMQKKTSVLISSGGGDQYNALAGILEHAHVRKQLEEVEFHVIVGGFNRHVGELEALVLKHQNVVLHQQVSNIAELMNQCTMAISAAGTMLYELAAMQVPTVFFLCADNQKYDSDFFEEDNRMLYAGDIRTNKALCLEQICDHTEWLLQHIEEQNRMKEKLLQVTDGKGARRIAEAISVLE